MVADEEDGSLTETGDGHHLTTEATGTLEVALRKGAGVHRLAIAMIEKETIDIKMRNPGVIRGLIGTAGTCSRTNSELGVSAHRSLKH